LTEIKKSKVKHDRVFSRGGADKEFNLPGWKYCHSFVTPKARTRLVSSYCIMPTRFQKNQQDYLPSLHMEGPKYRCGQAMCLIHDMTKNETSAQKIIVSAVVCLQTR